MPIISIYYSIPYLIFFGYLLLLMFWEFHFINKAKSIAPVQWAVIVGFLFFFGLRGHVYTDWYNYYPYFENLPTLWEGWNIADRMSGFEIGFEYYSILVKSIWNNYFFWVFVNALIDVMILHLIFRKYSKYYVLAFIFFVLFNGFIMEMSGYRNIKSILLFFLSIQYLQARKIVPYMLLNILGVLFHISSIIYLPLYFFLHKKISKKLILSIFIIGNIIFLLQIEYFKPVLQLLGDIIGGRVQTKVLAYMADITYNQPYGITIGYIERFFSFILVFIYSDKLIKQSPYNKIFINAFYIYIILALYFTEMNILFGRIGILFCFSYCFLFSGIYSLIGQKRNKLLFIGVLIMYGSLKLMKGNNTILNHYDNLLFGIESYENKSPGFMEKIIEVENQKK